MYRVRVTRKNVQSIENKNKRFVIFRNWKKFHLSLACSVRVIFIKIRNSTNISICESPTSAICLSLYKISYLFKLQSNMLLEQYFQPFLVTRRLYNTKQLGYLVCDETWQNLRQKDLHVKRLNDIHQTETST